jgi:DNA-binding NarL/FixJ family response regulator
LIHLPGCPDLPFNPSDPRLASHWKRFDAVISRWPVVVGTGDEIEAFLCAVLSRRSGVQTRLLGAGLCEREVLDLLNSEPSACLLLLSDSIAADQGVALLERCRQLPQPPQVLYCLSSADAVDVDRLLGLGVSVILSIHSIGKLNFREAADSLEQGLPYVDPAVHRALAIAADLGDELSVRERQVLSLLAKGLTNREIAEQLFIAPSTARDYVSVLISKFKAGNRVEVAARAVELGYSSQLPRL